MEQENINENTKYPNYAKEKFVKKNQFTDKANERSCDETFSSCLKNQNGTKAVKRWRKLNTSNRGYP